MSKDKFNKPGNVEVRFFNGDNWPEKRVSLGCKDTGRCIMISARYAEISEAKNDVEHIAKCVNNYHRLVGLVIDSIEDDGEFNTEWNTSAINLLNELDEI